VFSPALFVGAMLGAAFWHAAAALFPELASSEGAYAIVGMAAVASAMLGAPISTLLIVFELTLDYHLTVGVMLAAAVASTLMQAAGARSFFRWQLKQRGIDIVAGRDQSLLLSSNIDELVSKHFSRVSAWVTLNEAQTSLLTEGTRVALLVEGENQLCGSLALREALAAMRECGGDSEALASARDASVCVPLHSSLNGALEAMRTHDLHYMPVVEEVEERKRVVGVIFRDQVLDACNRVLREARAEETALG
jgi:CIC family chloride channel protein